MWLAQPPAKRKENPPPSRESTVTRKYPPRCTSARRGDLGETFGILERCPSLQGETENTVYTTNKRIPLGFSKSFWNSGHPRVCSYVVENPSKGRSLPDRTLQSGPCWCDCPGCVPGFWASRWRCVTSLPWGQIFPFLICDRVKTLLCPG